MLEQLEDGKDVIEIHAGKTAHSNMFESVDGFQAFDAVAENGDQDVSVIPSSSGKLGPALWPSQTWTVAVRS